MSGNAAVKINENERKVLGVLTKDYDGLAFNFKGISANIDGGMDLKAVRRACRSLKKKGLAEFHRGLFDDDGSVAGSGYSATNAGAALMCPCDVCGDVATFEYVLDGWGRTAWQADFEQKTSITIRECHRHYQKSQKASQLPL